MIRILVADDHAIVREGLKQIIADTTDIVIADEASNGQEVLNKVLKNVSFLEKAFISTGYRYSL